ncbi:hypothetical protein [Streptomyces sp. HUAS ZL42]|uniref:hypothetical protein n=1 Tax=Streptomyces sp. HUAS ZL42 TaxID=3231715 RepID=UPI00345F09CE
MRGPLPDGSCLTMVCVGRYRAGGGYGRLEVGIVEVRMAVTLADGTRRSELWRMMTTLLDTERCPAHELMALYHRRWQAETCSFSLESSLLGGRVGRSRTVPGGGAGGLGRHRPPGPWARGDHFLAGIQPCWLVLRYNPLRIVGV